MLGTGALRPISSPDSEDDDGAVTRVGKLPPDFGGDRGQAGAGPRAASPRDAQPQQQPRLPMGAPVAPQVAAQPRKAARRRTLSRGEQSPLAQGRRPTHDGRDAHEGRGGHASQAHGRADHRGGHAAPAPAADPRKQTARTAPPSEVPTAPGNDARVGAARAAALRALALPDDEVTAQRDVSVLNRLKELKDLAVDDLDEDTSVLPGLKIKEATAAAVAAKKAAEARQQHEEPSRAATRQSPAGQGAAAPYAAAPYTTANEDDRPTPADADAELSATSPPDTSRGALAAAEAAAANLTGDTGRYSAIDALWVTSDAAAPSRGRSLTVQNPAAALEAAAADAAVAAAHEARPARGPERAPAPAPTPATAAASPVCAFRVVVFGPDRTGEIRVTALAPSASPPPGATTAMLVATTEAESVELARIFGYTG